MVLAELITPADVVEVDHCWVWAEETTADKGRLGRVRAAIPGYLRAGFFLLTNPSSEFSNLIKLGHNREVLDMTLTNQEEEAGLLWTNCGLIVNVDLIPAFGVERVEGTHVRVFLF